MCTMMNRFRELSQFKGQLSLNQFHEFRYLCPMRSTYLAARVTKSKWEIFASNPNTKLWIWKSWKRIWELLTYPTWDALQKHEMSIQVPAFLILWKEKLDVTLIFMEAVILEGTYAQPSLSYLTLKWWQLSSLSWMTMRYLPWQDAYLHARRIFTL